MEVGGPVTTRLERHPGRGLGPGLLGQQALVLGLVGDLGGEVLENPAAQVAQLPGPEHRCLLDQVGLGLDDQVVTQAEILERIAAAFPLEPILRGHEPAERFRYRDGRGEVGVIPSVTRPFCEQCDRLRLTADGQLRSCLFSLEDHDLRGILRAAGSDDDLSAAIEACVGAKWAGHAIGQVQFVKPSRSMSQIGG